MVLWVGMGGGAGLLVVAFVVVLALVLANRLPAPIDTDGAPEKTRVWSDESARGVDPEQLQHVFWVDGDTVVRLLGERLAGFDLTTGEQRWATRLGRGKFCAIGGQARGGYTYAWGQVGGQCRELLRFDTATGVVVERFDLRSVLGRSTAANGLPPSVSDAGELLVLSESGTSRQDRLVGVDREDPARLRWEATIAKGCDLTDSSESDVTVFVVGRCGEGSTTVESFDIRTGRRLWRAEVAILVEQILHVSPPTLLTAGPRSEALVLDVDSGRTKSRIDLTWRGVAHRPADVIVAGGAAIVHTADVGDGERLAAYDLGTGKKLWHRIEERYSFSPLRRVGQDVFTVAIAAGEDDKASDAVLRVSARDGKPTTLASLRPNDLDISTDGDVAWTGRYLVVEFGTTPHEATVDEGPLVYS